MSLVFNELRRESSPSESTECSYSLQDTPLAALLSLDGLAGDARLSRDIVIDSMVDGFLVAALVVSLRRVATTGLVVRDESLDEMLRGRSGRFV